MWIQIFYVHESQLFCCCSNPQRPSEAKFSNVYLMCAKCATADGYLDHTAIYAPLVCSWTKDAEYWVSLPICMSALQNTVLSLEYALFNRINTVNIHPLDTAESQRRFGQSGSRIVTAGWVSPNIPEVPIHLNCLQNNRNCIIHIPTHSLMKTSILKKNTGRLASKPRRNV